MTKDFEYYRKLAESYKDCKCISAFVNKHTTLLQFIMEYIKPGGALEDRMETEMIDKIDSHARYHHDE